MVSSSMFLSLLESPDFQSVGAVAMFLFLSVLMICIFGFISIAIWTEARRKEREAYYKAESLRRVAESSGEGAKYVIEMMREEERNRMARIYAQEEKKKDGLKIGGVVNIGISIPLMIFLAAVGKGSPVYLIGLIPLFIGVALLASVFFLIAKPDGQ